MSQEAKSTDELLVVYQQPDVYSLVPKDTTKDAFIEQWLHDRPETTQDAYRMSIYRFMLFLGDTSFREVHLVDLQMFADTLNYLKPATKASILKAVKSMYSFAEKTGYLDLNVGAAIRLKKQKRHLAERILSEEQVHTIIGREENPRNHALLRFLYISGARVSEACKLLWKDFQDRDNGMGQVTFDGKGDKERTILLPATLYQEVMALKNDSDDNEPVFVSRNHGHLDASQVHRIVEGAAVRANVQTYTGERKRTDKATHIVTVTKIKKSRVSPHYFRHAHASHALDRGVPPHVVQATLGHASLATTTIYSHARPDTSSALKLV